MTIDRGNNISLKGSEIIISCSWKCLIPSKSNVVAFTILMSLELQVWVLHSEKWHITLTAESLTFNIQSLCVMASITMTTVKILNTKYFFSHSCVSHEYHLWMLWNFTVSIEKESRWRSLKTKCGCVTV